MLKRESSIVTGIIGLGLFLSGCSSLPKLSSSESPIVFNPTSAERIEPLLKAPEPQPCTSTREYITTLEFLREHMSLVGHDPGAQAVADRVSQGCTGAALRFINVAVVLSKTELDNPTIVKTAIDLSRKDDAATRAFLSIFQKSYLPNQLDLDLGTSLKNALRLVGETKAFTSDLADAEFGNYVAFCLSSENLNLPKPKCATWAVEMADLTVSAKRPLFVQFKELYQFLRDQSEQSLAVPQTLEVCAKVLKQGSEASANFVQAYKYALSAKGLKGTHKSALEFALTLAGRTRPVLQ